MATAASKLKLYQYKVGGIVHTAQMTAEDADRLEAKEVKAAPAPTTKAATPPENK